MKTNLIGNLNCYRLRKTFHAYLDDQCREAERSKIEKHLATCVACRMDIEETAALIQQLKDLPVMGMSIDLSKEDWQSFIEQELTYIDRIKSVHSRGLLFFGHHKYAVGAAASLFFLFVFLVSHYFPYYNSGILHTDVESADNDGHSNNAGRSIEGLADDLPMNEFIEENLDMANDEENLDAIGL